MVCTQVDPGQDLALAKAVMDIGELESQSVTSRI